MNGVKSRERAVYAYEVGDWCRFASHGRGRTVTSPYLKFKIQKINSRDGAVRSAVR